MKNHILFLFVILLLANCSSKKIELEERYGYDLVNSGDHKLTSKTIGEGEVSVLFESGLGDSCNVWIDSGIVKSLDNEVKIILYNRAGISNSDNTDDVASIENMIMDLDAIITTLADGDKLILVGHSLGGAIIRAYSVVDARFNIA